MDNVLITGTSGFVGRNISILFDKENRHYTSLPLRGYWQSSIVKEYTAIIHLAGKAHDIKNVSDPNEYLEINTNLTIQLFDIFLKGPARDFIFMSSVKAAADAVNGVLIESVNAQPGTTYGKSKLKAEEYILSQSLPEGKRVFILRPCMIHGPGNKGNLNLLYGVVKKGIPYPLGAFRNQRSFLSIDNLLFVIQSILDQAAIPGGVYQVADDEPLSTTTIIKLIGETINKKARILNVSIPFIKAIAKMGDVLSLPLNTERLTKMTESYVVSNVKIKKALGIARFPTSSQEGLIHTIKSFDKV
ncbi:MAG TPA: NAD-dependent epimerase/dehydratase family protein [Pseudosphingobacterium sp.]|nr:NAD-dependent epimerase/dehydratase family protein [Pseudosphingobacterium sp.]